MVLAPIALLGPEPSGKNGGKDKEERKARKLLAFRITEKLAEWNLRVEDVTEAGGRMVLLVSTGFEELCQEAEEMGVMKALAEPKPDEDSLQLRKDGSGEVQLALSEFRCDMASSFVGFTKAMKEASIGSLETSMTAAEDFFEPWEVLMLTRRRLNRVLAAESTGSSGLRHSGSGLVEDVRQSTEPLLHALLREEKLESVRALHSVSPRLRLFPCSADGLDRIHECFGDGVASYFVFMRTYTFWLILPGIFGLFLKLTREKGTSVDNSTKIPLYELFIVLWAAAFPSLLDRADAHFACRWGRLEASQHTEVRPGYHGERVISPITGEMEVYYPSWKRMLKYLVSTVVTLMMLLVAFGVMIISLNLQGYIHNKGSSEAHGLETVFGSPFYVESVAWLAAPGAVFDPAGDGDPLFFGYITFVPVILHVIVIMFLNKAYRHVAEVLTEWENHRTEANANNALIVKRFLFEAFDCYVALFYIAFYERNLSNLRSELISLYNVDCLRRLFLETVVPYVMKQVETYKKKQKEAASKKDDDLPDESMGSVEEQLCREEAEEFDDYLEMVIQFGYVTLFAGAFPIAGCLSVACNIVEIYSDYFKLNRVYQRPMAYASRGMPRTWHAIIKCICWLSVLTNVLVFGFVTEQAMQFFSVGKGGFFKPAPSEQSEHVVKRGGVWVLFWLENSVLVLCTVIHTCFPKMPSWVSNALLSRKHRRALLARRAMRRNRRKSHAMRDPAREAPEEIPTEAPKDAELPPPPFHTARGGGGDESDAAAGASPPPFHTAMATRDGDETSPPPFHTAVSGKEGVGTGAPPPFHTAAEDAPLPFHTAAEGRPALESAPPFHTAADEGRTTASEVVYAPPPAATVYVTKDIESDDEARETFVPPPTETMYSNNAEESSLRHRR
eukprot:TRINITY_DN33835_c0_g1_i1.p1 TRINITY_DN33835_c0_g1~~TRINITY_DN33835_c0_g1_i1.p1  ORF type:complete len:900 (-),score=238.81 TRINITY_DN33835_c0_g1_i1:185-2884(-)